MIDHAEREFALAAPDKDGHPLRETLQGLLDRCRKKKRRAELEEQLRVPPRPEALDYLWKAYFRIRRRVNSGGFGRAPFGWGDIAAFVQFSGLKLAPWEVDILEDIDDAWLASHVEKKEQGEEE
ncbi:phage tail assembly chaperone [Shinella sp.]|uniref:phage tail assembly chaperone n=1 Tax=Shinella sp. TaxID=1870904 RepID=UPI003F6F9288